MSLPGKSSKQTSSKKNSSVATKINKTKPVDISSQNTTKDDIQNLVKIISNGENNIRQDLIAISQKIASLHKKQNEFDFNLGSLAKLIGIASSIHALLLIVGWFI